MGICVGDVRHYVNCYFAMNETRTDFHMKLDHFEDKLRETEGPAILGEDVNAKAVESGMELMGS